MRITFDYTVEDYREANRAHFAARMVRKWLWLWITLLLAGLAVVVWMRSPPPKPIAVRISSNGVSAMGVATTGPLPQASLMDLILPVMPWVFLVPFLFIVVRSRSVGPKKRFVDVSKNMNPWTTRLGWLMAVIAGTIFIGLIVHATGLTDSTGTNTDSGPMDTLLPLIPWVGLLIFFFLFFRRAIRRAWKLQPALQRSKTFEYSPEQISISDDLTSMAYRWPAIVRCIEAPKLFSLYVSEMSFHMVPKRAFPSPEAVDGFRRLIQEWADGRSVGFPVIQTPAQDANALR